MGQAIKVYEEQHVRYQFNAENFKNLINQKKLDMSENDRRVTNAKIIEELADDLYLSVDAVKNWMYGHHGPCDLEQIKQIGDFLNYDYHYLLKKEDT